MSHNKKVIIYTFKHCPYCIKAKKLLNKEHISYTEIEVNHQELRDLEKKTDLGTVPQVIVDEVLIGGCDDLYKLYKDKELFNKTFFN